jgi:alpha-1,3-glucosyltransferase
MLAYCCLLQVGPKATAALVLLAQLPCLVALWHQPRPSKFALAVTYANLCGFMWGYHVHEKAIITALLPLAWALAANEDLHPSSFVLLSSAGHVGIFPLLHQMAEIPVRWALALVYYVGSLWAVPALASSSVAAAVPTGAASSRSGKPRQQAGSPGMLPAWLGMPVKLYLVGLVLLEAYCSTGHQLLLQGRLPFLPLLLTSTYCAVGVGWVWAQMCWSYVEQCRSGGSHSNGIKGVQTRAGSRAAEQARKQD